MMRREHFQVLRDTPSRQRGREVKNTGDGLMVSFPSSSSAVECGVRMQQLMERRNRRSDEQLHLRIGISGPGEATVEGGDTRDAVDQGGTSCDQAPSDGIFASAMAKDDGGAPRGTFV